MIDILQPDCGHTGGITQMKKIAALAESHHVPIAPHCTMSYLGLTASLHVAASVPFLLTPGQARGPAPTVISWVNAGPLSYFVMY